MKDRPALSIEAIRHDFTNSLHSPISENPDQQSMEVALSTLYPWADDVRERFEGGDKTESLREMNAALPARIEELEGRLTEMYPHSEFAKTRDVGLEDLKTIDWKPVELESFEPDHEDLDMGFD